MLESLRQPKRATVKGVSNCESVDAVLLAGGGVSLTNGGGAIRSNGVPVASRGVLTSRTASLGANTGESRTIGTPTPTIQRESRSASLLHGSFARQVGDVAVMKGSATRGPVAFTWR